MSQIIIYHTNDLHGRLSTHDENEKSIGIDKIAKVVNLSLLQNKNTFWFDSGDFQSGTPRMNYAPMEELINTLNSTHLNASVTGNHDYNFGFDHLYELSKKLNMYILSANTVDKFTKLPALLPYIIYEVDIEQNDYISENSNDSTLDNIKIGVFGISTPETAYKTNPNNVRNVDFLNPILTSRYMVDLLSRNCDIIIALTHLGLDASSEYTSKKLAEEVKGIDLILDGHSHTSLEQGLWVNNTLIAQTGAHGEFLGKIILDIENRKIQNMQASLINEEQVDKLIKTVDTYIEHKIEVIDEITNLALNQKVAYNNKFLSGERELVRRRECELGNFIADACRYMTKANISIINGGNIRTDLKQGDLTRKDIITVCPFENQIQTYEIAGLKIKEMLEHSIANAPDSSFGGFLHISGAKFTYDPKKQQGNKVIDIFIDNERIDYDKTYIISITDFQAVGGDNYTMLMNLKKIGEFGTLENMFIYYLTHVDAKEYHYELGRIKVL